jgi:hypothetical protein
LNAESNDIKKRGRIESIIHEQKEKHLKTIEILLIPHYLNCKKKKEK